MAHERALVRNAGSAKQVRAARESEQFAREAADLRLAGILGTYDGRWWMWDHLGTYGIRDAREVYSAEIYGMQGKRTLGVQLEHQIIRVAPDAYLLMQKENIEREKQKIEPKARTDDPLEDEDDAT